MKKASLITPVKVGLVTALIGAAGLGAVKGLDNLDAIVAANRSTLTFDLDRVDPQSVQYDTEQLFVSSNPRLSQDHETNGHAYVFVHAGYFGKGNNPKYGGADEYKAYIESVKQLIGELNDSNALVLFMTEPTPYRSGELLDLLDDPFVVVTEYDSPHLKTRVKTDMGIEEQNEDLVYSFLRANDVEEVRFIGEMAWWGSGLACLGNVAESFYEHGFRIRGVEGSVFPTRPNEGVWMNLDPRGRVEEFYDALGLHKGISNSDIMSRIYDNPIVLNQK